MKEREKGSGRKSLGEDSKEKGKNKSSSSKGKSSPSVSTESTGKSSPVVGTDTRAEEEGIHAPRRFIPIKETPLTPVPAPFDTAALMQSLLTLVKGEVASLYGEVYMVQPSVWQAKQTTSGVSTQLEESLEVLGNKFQVTDETIASEEE